MADGSTRIDAGSTVETIASDDIGGVKYQRVKLSLGPDGTANEVGADDGSFDYPPNKIGMWGNARGYIWNPGSSIWVRSPTGVGDGTSFGLVPAQYPMLYNGLSLNLQRGNEDRTLLASAARTISTAAPAQTNYNARGVIVLIYVTAGSGFSIMPQIYMLDALSSQWESQVVGATITTASPTPHTIIAYPGATLGALTNHTVASVPLARQWGVYITHNNANSVTYSVGCCLIL